MPDRCLQAADEANRMTVDQITVPASRRYGTLSPLRYPGGKAALAGLFADLIRELKIKDATYVEPYAGGAGAGVALLREGLVSRLVINDVDPAVHSFWTSVVSDNDRFIEQVREVPLTVEEWKVQRDRYRQQDCDPFDRGFAFFYLNRTNRSGVLNAGVIGGQAQTGEYKINARFNRETLVSRLSAIGRLAGQIEVTAVDGREVIEKYSADETAFLYIDPPYVHAGSQLYLNAFGADDHANLAAAVGTVSAAHWLMTYDVAPLISALYDGFFQCRLALNYSARYPGEAEELLIASSDVADVVKRLFPAEAEAGGALAPESED